MFVVASRPDPSPNVWQALADPTRRELIDRLATGPRTTSDLCAGFAMTRFGVMKHLGVLEAAGIVIGRKQGRVRTNHLNAAALMALQRRWLSPRAQARGAGILTLSDSIEQGDHIMADADTGAGIAEIALEWTIAASAQRVWQALFDAPETWWPAEHRAIGGAARMSFAPELGARLVETNEDGAGVAWYSVYAIDPLRSVDLRGDLASRYGGPATSLLHIELAPSATDRSTVVKLTDSLFGRVGAGTQAAVADGWQAIIGGLVGYCAA